MNYLSALADLLLRADASGDSRAIRTIMWCCESVEAEDLSQILGLTVARWQAATEIEHDALGIALEYLWARKERANG